MEGGNPLLLLKQKIASNHKLLQEITALKHENQELKNKVQALEEARVIQDLEIAQKVANVKVGSTQTDPGPPKKDAGIQTTANKNKKAVECQTEEDPALKELRKHQEIMENLAQRSMKRHGDPLQNSQPIKKFKDNDRKMIPFFGPGFGLTFLKKPRKKIEFCLAGSLDTRASSSSRFLESRPPPDLTIDDDRCPPNANRVQLLTPRWKIKKGPAKSSKVRPIKKSKDSRVPKAPKVRVKIQAPDPPRSPSKKKSKKDSDTSEKLDDQTQDSSMMSSEDEVPPIVQKAALDAKIPERVEVEKIPKEKKVKKSVMFQPMPKASGSTFIPLGISFNTLAPNTERSAAASVRRPANELSKKPDPPLEKPKEVMEKPREVAEKPKSSFEIKRSVNSKQRFRNTLMVEEVFKPERRNCPKLFNTPPRVPLKQKPKKDQSDSQQPTQLPVAPKPGPSEDIKADPTVAAKELPIPTKENRDDAKEILKPQADADTLRRVSMDLDLSDMSASSDDDDEVTKDVGSKSNNNTEKMLNLSITSEDDEGEMKKKDDENDRKLEDGLDHGGAVQRSGSLQHQDVRPDIERLEEEGHDQGDDQMFTSPEQKTSNDDSNANVDKTGSLFDLSVTSEEDESEAKKDDQVVGDERVDQADYRNKEETNKEEEGKENPKDEGGNEKSKNILEEVVKKYQAEDYKKKIELNRVKQMMKSKKFENSLAGELALSVVQIQFGRLWKKCDKETMDNIVKQLTSEKATACNFKRTFVQVAYMALRDEKEWEAVTEVANYAPLLTNKQSKVLALMIMLERNTADETDVNSMNTVMDDLMKFIEYTVLDRSKQQALKTPMLANLCRFYMAMVRYKGYEVKARMFIYGVLYFKSPRSHVMLTVFFDTWPEILFWTGSSETVVDPLLETVVWMIHNTGPEMNKQDMKVYETRGKLSDLCGLPNPGSTGSDLVRHLIKRAENGSQDDLLLTACMRSLNLMARAQDFRWANNHIVRRLLDLLGRCWRDKDCDKSAKLLCWVVNTVGHVARVYTVEGRNSLLSIFEPVSKLLEDPNVSPELEEACLKCLIWSGHHLQLQVSKFLVSWTPKHPLKADVYNLLKNFAGTRANFHSNTTVKVNKKKKIYEAKQSKP